MNIFAKIKLASKLSADAEMINAYYLKIKRWYETNFYHSTWVCHLHDHELQCLGIKRPYEYKYLNIQGDPTKQSSPLQSKVLNHDTNYQPLDKAFNDNLVYRHSYNSAYDREYKRTGDPVKASNYAKQWVEEIMKENEKKTQLYKIAKEWAKTIGAKTVAVFKNNSVEPYLQMLEDVKPKIYEFIWLYKQLYGEIKDPKLYTSVKYIQARIEEVKKTEYFIERATEWQ